jgi:hypothetical protein
MARQIVVVVMYLRLAGEQIPDRVGLAVLLELFARYELTGCARFETVVKLPQFIRQTATESLRHLHLTSGFVSVTDRSESPAQLVDQHGPGNRRIAVQLRLCDYPRHSPEFSHSISAGRRFIRTVLGRSSESV